MYVDSHIDCFSLSLNLDIWESKLVKCNGHDVVTYQNTIIMYTSQFSDNSSMYQNVHAVPQVK